MFGESIKTTHSHKDINRHSPKTINLSHIFIVFTMIILHNEDEDAHVTNSLNMMISALISNLNLYPEFFRE